MTTTNTIDGRPRRAAAQMLPLLLGCGEPLRGGAAPAGTARPAGGRGRPALSIQLPARLLEQRLTRHRR
jgi:hypothetical protein